MRYEEWRCQFCGEPIGYVGRFFFWLFGVKYHRCKGVSPYIGVEEFIREYKMICSRYKFYITDLSGDCRIEPISEIQDNVDNTVIGFLEDYKLNYPKKS